MDVWLKKKKDQTWEVIFYRIHRQWHRRQSTMSDAERWWRSLHEERWLRIKLLNRRFKCFWLIHHFKRNSNYVVYETCALKTLSLLIPCLCSDIAPRCWGHLTWDVATSRRTKVQNFFLLAVQDFFSVLKTLKPVILLNIWWIFIPRHF